MPILVAGKLIIKAGYRAAFIRLSQQSVRAAREDPACCDFSVSPDPIDLNRVNVYEKWANQAALDRFRGSGPETDSFSMVQAFHVMEYDVEDAVTVQSHRS